MSNIYKRRNIVLGFHGGDKEPLMKIIQRSEPDLILSKNSYDWLGDGAYFWLNDPERAWLWAKEQYEKGKCKEPFVIGAVIDLGNCLDLSNQEDIKAIQFAYEELEKLGNINVANIHPDEGGFSLKRDLDCMVLNYACALIGKIDPSREVDTVIGYFEEGGKAYPGAAFYKKTHAQICVRKHSQILGYFVPKFDFPKNWNLLINMTNISLLLFQGDF